MTDNRIIGEFISANEPSETEKNKLAAYFEKKLNAAVLIKWVKDETVKKGFILKIRNEFYDNTPDGILKDLKSAVDGIDKSKSDYISLVKESVENWTPRAFSGEVGTVISVADGVAKVAFRKRRKGTRSRYYGNRNRLHTFRRRKHSRGRKRLQNGQNRGDSRIGRNYRKSRKRARRTDRRKRKYRFGQIYARREPRSRDYRQEPRKRTFKNGNFNDRRHVPDRKGTERAYNRRQTDR